MKNSFKLVDEAARQVELPDDVAVFERTVLVKALKRLFPVISRRHKTLPILRCVLFDIGSDGATMIRATNLEMDVCVPLTAEHTPRQMRFTVPFAPLWKAARMMRGEWIGIRAEERKVKFFSGTVSVTAYTCPAEDFPEAIPGRELPLARNVLGCCSDFLDDLGRAQKCTGQDDSRRALTGIYLEKEGDRAIVTATDGKRLLTIRSTTMLGDELKPVILPGSCIPALKNAFAENAGIMVMKQHDSHVLLEKCGIRVTLKKVDGEYPHYHQVIPSRFAGRLRLSAFLLEWLIDCVELVKAADNYAEMYLKSDRLELRTENGGVEAVGSAFCDLRDGDCTMPPGHQEFHFIFNPDFLRAAALAGEDLQFNFNDHLNPVMFSGSRRDYVLMPIRKK